MKIKIDLPWGGQLYYERAPLSKDAMESRNSMLAGVVLGLFFLIFFSMFR